MRADRIPGTMGLLVFCALLLSAASPSAVYRATGIHPKQSCISFLASSADPTARLTCAGNFTLREMACYSYSGLSVRRSFHHAERYCFKLRASLASLLSPAEENFVIQLADDDTAFWIGLTDQGNTTQAQFTWSDGTALMLTSHTHWQAGEPSNAGHLHCVQVDKDGWALARGGCASTKLPFVCKKHGELLLSATN